MADDVIEIELPDRRLIRIEPVEDPKLGEDHFVLTLRDPTTGDVIRELRSTYVDEEGGHARWSVPPPV